MKLNTISHPGDMVVAFLDYYYDLSVYIQKPLFMVEPWSSLKNKNADDWRGMFVLASKFKGSQKQWLITEQQLQKFWHTKKVFIVANKCFLPILTALLSGKPKLVMSYQKTILITN
jgi:hypothetical protein